MLAVLLRGEWLKTRKRFAFWLPLAFYTLIVSPLPLFEGDDEFRLPDAWEWVFDVRGSTTLVFFAALTLLLLATPEFGWRTVRQNVIDGLSKSQWLLGKLLLVLIVSLSFTAAHVLPSAVFAFSQTETSMPGTALVPAAALGATGGLLLCCMTAGAWGMLLSTAIRNTAAAIGVWILWVSLIEPSVIVPFVHRQFPDLVDWLAYLPARNAMMLLEFDHFRALGTGQPLPGFVGLVHHTVGAIAWSALFLGAAWFWFRRRDL